MKIINRDIDSGKPFDWGKTSLDYAKLCLSFIVC